MSIKIRKQDALLYHSKGRPGKIEVIPTKETKSQRDLSLAYSPGVAEACLEIAEKRSNVFKYTAKGNLVAVISNGSAVLGLPVNERLEGTAATVALAIANGADIVRVHDVKEMVRVTRMTDAIVKGIV